MGMLGTASRDCGWAVLGDDDRVVLILLGGDADEAAKDWSSDGYRILPVALAAPSAVPSGDELVDLAAASGARGAA